MLIKSIQIGNWRFSVWCRKRVVHELNVGFYEKTYEIGFDYKNQNENESFPFREWVFAFTSNKSI